jgi:cell division control protein 6
VDEISQIIKERLLSLNESDEQAASSSVPLMQTNAIEIAARKIANTGDLRKALDVCRYVDFNCRLY